MLFSIYFYCKNEKNDVPLQMKIVHIMNNRFDIISVK